MTPRYGEPWRDDGLGDRRDIWDSSEPTLGSSIMVATATTTGYAQRIIACVNLCAGFSYEALEGMAKGDLLKALQELKPPPRNGSVIP